MKILNKTITNTINWLFMVFLLIGLSVGKQQIVDADMAPPPNPEIGGLLPFQETEVQMVYERVEMELEFFQSEMIPDRDANRITVNAYFLMKNQGEVDESMQVVFPLSTSPFCFGTTSDTSGTSFTYYEIDHESFQATIDGISAPISVIRTKYNICDNYPWAAFDVQFPVGKEVLIKVTYMMESLALDSIQVLDYVLLTGAGWKDSIGSGYIIMKFPYAITSDAILSDSTSEYQILHNEVFWSFTNLEPAVEDNIHLSFISPDVWMNIQDYRQTIETKPDSPDAWLGLIDSYVGISTTHGGDIIRDTTFFGKIEPAFQEALYYNPDNAELNARYAQFLLHQASPHLMEKISDSSSTQILSLLNKALSLESDNQTANQTIKELMWVSPSLTFTPPATVSPTTTALESATPSVTPTLIATFTPESKPITPTVAVSKTPKRATSTPTVETLVFPSQANDKNSTSLVFLFIVVFIIGLGAGIFLSKYKD